jgi:restriction system protein
LPSAPAHKTDDDDLSRAEIAYAGIADKLSTASAAIIPIESRLHRQQRLCRVLTRALHLRMIADQYTTRPGGLLIAAAATVAIAVVLVGVFTRSAGPLVIGAALGTLLSAAVWPFVLFAPSDSAVKSRLAMSERLQAQLHHEHRLMIDNRSDLQTRLQATEKTCQELNRERASRLHWLRTRQWKLMQGGEFEQFLGQLFEERGYSVQFTGKSGDQGVDLILSKPDVRIAVQAKGYLAGIVANEAVQQVYAGMAFHRCRRCAVVTNSKFTRSAVELADTVQCTLIDGDKIDHLLDGSIDV